MIPNPNMGFSLLEVLIAWSISITIILGALIGSNKFLKNVHHHYLQSIAMNRAQEMLERLQVNRNPNSRLMEFNLWNEDNEYWLPKGDGQLSCSVETKICQVLVNWQEKQSMTLQISEWFE